MAVKETKGIDHGGWLPGSGKESGTGSEQRAKPKLSPVTEL